MENPTCKEKKQLAFRQQVYRIPLDGSEAEESYITETERNDKQPVMYYMAVMDCDNNIHNAIGDHFHWIKISVTMTANDDHFPFCKQGIILSDTLLLVIYCMLFIFVCYNMYSFENKFGTWNTPHVYCLIAMAFQAIAICCNLTHWMQYASDGEGYHFMLIMATIFDLCSECLMILLILLLANGWYTRFKEINLINAVEHVFTYGPIFLMVIVIEVLIVALGEMDKNAQHKYHDFHGWMGFALIATKLSLVALFYYFYSNCVDKIRPESKQFYH